MKLSIVLAGFFKLDGGAMFGIVPKVMWNKMNPADEDNMCSWAMRSLLIETDTRKILIDTGIGQKQGEKFRSHFHPYGKDVLESLSDLGIKSSDITDVFLTHLHFDHCGDAVKIDEQGNYVPTFENAQYWINKKHWEWALESNPREKASFLPENYMPLQEAGVLNLIDFRGENSTNWLEGIRLIECNGHTRGLTMLDIPYQDTRMIYLTDLIPSVHHVPLPYIMAYDLWPWDTLEEKTAVLEQAVAERHVLFFQHDPVNAVARVRKNEKGRIVAFDISSELY
ncbi:MAG TPA: MBL fold metallo-hydrolase [Saprospiraceae bacterium]|nr:MBL fold metallo-hydrolase [Saprospiraceae bacterium]HRN32966.1 MBL fold metallo-hydrolase [Saprospiraceae bacterium]HRP84921.1 MBL fold metallo-hydrolase [Saprospiraceae bacterium]